MYQMPAVLNAFLLASCSAIITIVSSSTTVNPCPRESLKTAMGCTASLGFIGQPTQFANKDVSDKLVDGCRSGIFVDAIKCIDDVMTGCQHDTSMASDFLRQNVNVDKMRHGIDHFCTNVNEYIADTECIQSNMDVVSNCSYAAKMNLLSKIAARNQTAIQRSQCSFFSKAVTCMVGIVRDKCRPKVSHIIGTVMKSFEPPVCEGSITYEIVAGSGVEDEQIQEQEDDPNNTSPGLRMIWSNFALAFTLLHTIMKLLLR